jgi:hypothetical protein
MRRPRTSVAVAVIAVIAVGVAFGLYWFQPWKLFTTNTVNDAVPQVVASGAPAGDTPSPGPAPGPSSSPSAATAVLLAQGTLISHEHDTTGTAQLIRLADGRYQLVLRDLATSNGPDLRVWLTDQPVIPGGAGWHVFDDGRHAELGRLKGNQGTQVYDLPPGLDPAGYTSVTIWCKRFAVSFGAAALA